MPDEHLVVRADEGSPSGKQLEEHNTRGVQIAPLIDGLPEGEMKGSVPMIVPTDDQVRRLIRSSRVTFASREPRITRGCFCYRAVSAPRRLPGRSPREGSTGGQRSAEAREALG